MVDPAQVPSIWHLPFLVDSTTVFYQPRNIATLVNNINNTVLELTKMYSHLCKQVIQFRHRIFRLSDLMPVANLRILILFYPLLALVTVIHRCIVMMTLHKRLFYVTTPIFLLAACSTVWSSSTAPSTAENTVNAI